MSGGRFLVVQLCVEPIHMRFSLPPPYSSHPCDRPVVDPEGGRRGEGLNGEDQQGGPRGGPGGNQEGKQGRTRMGPMRRPRENQGRSQRGESRADQG